MSDEGRSHRPRRKSLFALAAETALVLIAVVMVLAMLTKLAPVAPGLVAFLRGLLRPLVLVPLLVALVAFRIARARR